jgi:signal peptidase I
MSLKGVWEFIRTVAFALLLALVVRTLVAQPFRIPSGSMQPTLAVGDYIIVSKWSYGYSRYSITPLQELFGPGRVLENEPRRGDVVVFHPPRKAEEAFVKRVIGLPGDRVQMIAGHVHINGVGVAREFLGRRTHMERNGVATSVLAFRETLPDTGISYTTFERGDRATRTCEQMFDGKPWDMCALDDTEVFVIPRGQYFMMGDDRDVSGDSRAQVEVSYIPLENMVGRVRLVVVSFDHSGQIGNPLTWFGSFRGDRFFMGVQ